jgi:hypothetical protein|nr:MAG TPA: hypothetical protein [Caudoviricetes sp.]
MQLPHRSIYFHNSCIDSCWLKFGVSIRENKSIQMMLYRKKRLLSPPIYASNRVKPAKLRLNCLKKLLLLWYVFVKNLPGIKSGKQQQKTSEIIEKRC